LNKLQPCSFWVTSHGFIFRSQLGWLKPISPFLYILSLYLDLLPDIIPWDFTGCKPKKNKYMKKFKKKISAKERRFGRCKDFEKRYKNIEI
jgi:hypothetical protein